MALVNNIFQALVNVFTNARLSVRPRMAAATPTPPAMPIPAGKSTPSPRRIASDRSAGPAEPPDFMIMRGFAPVFGATSPHDLGQRGGQRALCRTGGGPIEPDSPADLDVIAPILTLLRPIPGKTGRQRQDRQG
jgi:hypothetical protein